MSQIPNEFICPISQGMMVDPVSLPCGHTFDRTNVTNWINSNSTCPSCRHPVVVQNVYTNWSLKSLIEKYNNGDEDLIEDMTLITESVEEMELDDSFLKSIKATVSSKKKLIDLCLTIPDFEKRRPISFICVIDVSGSMGDTVGNAEGGKAFTRLDLVKHVLNVLISSLTESDRLALIAFSDDPEIVLDLIPMNASNKRMAKQCVASLQPLSSTYTGPALRKAYELVKKVPKNHIKSIILLTDGQDTDGSEILEKTFDLIKKPDQVQLNTFGFSNAIISDCLQRLAIKGKGIFGFIPDQSMIGTIFINFLANTFLTCVQTLHITLIDDGFKFAEEGNKLKKTSIIQFGKKHHFSLKNKKNLEINNGIKILIGYSYDRQIELKAEYQEDNEFDLKLLKCRNKMLEIVSNPDLVNQPEFSFSDYESKFKIPEFLAEIKQTDQPDPNNEQIKLSLQYWTTWGAHYVRSFKFAHMYEQAINFKSPSMKFYRTPRFDELIEKLTEIFITLPPPKPSGNSYGSGPQIIMTNIMDRNNGCILSSCLIELKSGEIKKIEDLQKGDILKNGSKVVCLVKSKYESFLVRINNLVLTPYHPIFYNFKWQFPIDVYLNSQRNCESISNGNISLVENDKPISVCNLVLDKKHFAKIEGFNCITLGHGYKQDYVLRHPYYGTKKCVQDLINLKGWNEGLIQMNNFEVLRDQNGLVKGINDKQLE